MPLMMISGGHDKCDEWRRLCFNMSFLRPEPIVRCGGGDSVYTRGRGIIAGCIVSSQPPKLINKSPPRNPRKRILLDWKMVLIIN